MIALKHKKRNEGVEKLIGWESVNQIGWGLREGSGGEDASSSSTQHRNPGWGG